jgi:hypothetical protein
LSDSEKKDFKKNISKDFCKVIIEIVGNLLKGNLRLSNETKQLLEKYKSRMRQLICVNRSLDDKKTIIQSGGFLAEILKIIGPTLFKELLSRI